MVQEMATKADPKQNDLDDGKYDITQPSNQNLDFVGLTKLNFFSDDKDVITRNIFPLNE